MEKTDLCHGLGSAEFAFQEFKSGFGNLLFTQHRTGFGDNLHKIHT